MTDPVECLVYSFAEVCVVLGVNSNLVRQWTNRSVHPLPHIKNGKGSGKLIYPKETTRQWLREEATRSDRPLGITELYAAVYDSAQSLKAAAGTANRASIRNGT